MPSATITDTPTTAPPLLTDPALDEARLLFQEAKQRRRRRWLVSGLVATVVVVLMGIALLTTTGRGGVGGVRPATNPPAAGAVTRSAADFSMRPVLCYAPPLSMGIGRQATTGPLPTCSAASMLSPANLGVSPTSASGYSVSSAITPDPRFAGYESTALRNDHADSTVLLPGTSATGSMRYVLGPAGLTASGIESVRVVDDHGSWGVSLQLTPAGSARWDAMTLEQFHAMIGAVVGGRVVSAPLTEPTESLPTSFHGHLQISGPFTRSQAEAVAARL